MGRWLFALVTAGVLSVIPLGSAVASATTAKRVAYVSGGTLRTIDASGTGTTNLGEIGFNPSFSSDGQTILFDDGVNVRSIPAAGGASSVVCGTIGTDPAISPGGAHVAYVAGGNVFVKQLDCAGSAIDLGAGSQPAWSPDGTQIVFVDTGNDLAVAPSTGGAAEKLASTSAVEIAPSWSPDGQKIAYVANNELYVLTFGGNPPTTQPLTNNSVVEESPSWAPGGDEIVYAAAGELQAIPAAGGSARVFQDATGASQPSWGLAVANTGAPTITLQSGGTYSEGAQLSASVGTWTSISGITSYAYRWLRCGSGGGGCVEISGATSGTYTLVNGDVGSTVRVRVTATSPDGSAPALSAPTPAISAAAPANVLPPTISGSAIIGGTLTASPGTWSGSNPVFTYQWQKCDSAGSASSCANLSGATNNVYVPVAADVGSTLRVGVTATNSLGSATAFSNATPIVASNIPAIVVVPALAPNISTLTGAVTSFTATTGTWSGAPTITFRYQWRRCDANGANCRDIPAAVSTTYNVAAADIGSRLRVVVTATNSFGTATATSEPSDLLAGTAPENTFLPSITGNEAAGSVVSASPGTWTGTAPLTYTYEWRRCNAVGASCAAIAGATSATYIVQNADVGSRLVVAVTAKNSAGSATAVSGPSDVITAASPGTTPATRPAVTSAPSFTGSLARGRTLRAVNGTWSGTTPMTFSYQWQRCPATGTLCADIAGATQATYVLVAADVGRRIRLVVTAANAAGSTPATTAISARVTATAAPAGRRINGTAKADRLTGGPGPDTIRGNGGNDRINGGAGADRILAGPGNDTVTAVDRTRDRIDCGAGRDTVVADRVDVVAKNCEKVTRRRCRAGASRAQYPAPYPLRGTVARICCW